MRPTTTSDAVWNVKADGVFYYKIRMRHPVDQIVAMFPFVGTLKQAQAEAARLTSCFTLDVYVRLSLWFED